MLIGGDWFFIFFQFFLIDFKNTNNFSIGDWDLLGFAALLGLVKLGYWGYWFLIGVDWRLVSIGL